MELEFELELDEEFELELLDELDELLELELFDEFDERFELELLFEFDQLEPPEPRRLPFLDLRLHDQHVEHPGARRPGGRRQPAQLGIGDQRQVAAHTGFELDKISRQHRPLLSMAAIARRRAKR